MSYVGNTNTTQAFTPAVDYFSGDGSTVAFTLSRPVASTAQVQVVVNNVPQNPTDAFTVLNNTITFTGAPSSGTNNIYVQYTSPITQIMQPGQGTVGAVQLAAGAVGTAGIAANAVTAAKLAREGSSGQVLTSNGAGSDPSYQSLPAGGVTSLNGQTGAITNTSLYAIGSYVTGRPKDTNGYAVDSTLAGSSLFATPPGARWSESSATFTPGPNDGADITSSCPQVNTGTWRCVSPAVSVTTGKRMNGLWVRIS